MKKKKKFNKKFYILAGIVIGMMIFIPLLANFVEKINQKEEKIETLYSQDFKEWLDYGYRGFLTPDCPEKKKRIDENGMEYIPRNIICELPEKPEDFERIKFLFETGKAGNMEDIKEEYWIQPEFVRNYEKTDLSFYQYPDINYLVRYSVTVYPSEQVLEIESESVKSNETVWETFEVPTTIRSSKTIFYTGIKLVQSIREGNFRMSENTFSDNTKEINNPEDLNNYIKVEFDPQQFVLAQSFPVYRMGEYDYAIKENVKINISNQIPKGKYMIGIKIVNPDKEFSNYHQFQRELDKKISSSDKLYNLYRYGGDDSSGLDIMRVFIWIN